MSLIKWADIDRWTEIDLDDLNAQAETLSNDSNKEIIKDALYTLKNSFALIEKKKSTKEKRDRMTKERINILIRLGFQIRLKTPEAKKEHVAESGNPTETAPTETAG